MYIVETMRRLLLPRGWVVRLWIEGISVTEIDPLVLRARQLATESDSKLMAADAIAALPHINAVEVIDEITGAGHVVYPDWP